MGGEHCSEAVVSLRSQDSAGLGSSAIADGPSLKNFFCMEYIEIWSDAVCVQAPTLITIIPTHVSVRDVGLQANPALIKVGQSPNVPISGPEGADKSSMRSPSPSGPLASNGGSGSGASSGGSGGGAEESIAPGLTFSLLP